MPAPLNVDREQVRMLVLSVGVREAARALGLSENTVLAWSNRFGWLEHITKPVAVLLPDSMKPAICAIRSPADTLTDIIAEDGQATRVAGMRYARRVTEHAAKLAEDAPSEALEQAQNVKASLQAAGIAGGWVTSGTTVNVAVALRLDHE